MVHQPGNRAANESSKMSSAILKQNQEAVKLQLVSATMRGCHRIVIGGIEWLRQPSGWAKTYSYSEDEHASYRWEELGVHP